MSAAKEKGLKVTQIFKYFKPNGQAYDKDITSADFQCAMTKMGWNITASELTELIDHFDEDKNGTVSMEEFQHYCYNIPHLAWKAEKIRWQREQALLAPKPSVNDAVATPEGDVELDANGLMIETPEMDASGAPAAAPSMVTSASAPAFATRKSASPVKQRSLLAAEQIYAGQKPLWKSKQFLTLKIGYQESMKVIAVSAKDAEDTVFEPIFVDGRRILAEKKNAIAEALTADLEKKASKGGRKPSKEDAATAEKEISESELANFIIRRLVTGADDPTVLTLAMLGSDGALKSGDIVYKDNPGVRAVAINPPNHSRRPSIEDFNAMANEVAVARDAAAEEREAGQEAIARLRQSLDAFSGIVKSKPFKEMTRREQVQCLLRRIATKHKVNKVTHRLQSSPSYKAMLKEQAAKKQSFGKTRRPSLVG